MKLTARSIKQYLKANGVELEDCDSSHIDNLVHCMEQLIVLRQTIEQDGPVLKNESGHGTATVKHPAITAYKEYTSLVVAWAKEFGLTPKARKDLMKGVEKPKGHGFDLHRKVKT